mgnify:CR=1 FL=1
MNINNIINLKDYTIDILIDKIIEQTSGNSRGYVDLAGLLINYDNKFVAEKLQEKMQDKKIIPVLTLEGSMGPIELLIYHIDDLKINKSKGN